MSELYETGPSIWGSQYTQGQKRGSRDAESWGPTALAPTHGFSPKHPWDHIAIMSDSFRAAEFTHHLSGQVLSWLGAMGWAREDQRNPLGPKDEEPLQGSAQCWGIHNRQENPQYLKLIGSQMVWMQN